MKSFSLLHDLSLEICEGASPMVVYNIFGVQEHDVHKTSQVYNTLYNKKTTIQNQVSFFINS